MNTLILIGVQIAASIWEMWMCYQLLLSTVIEDKYRTKRDQMIMVGTFMITGFLLGVNRISSFFSRTMFEFSNLLLIGVCISLNRRKKLLSVGIILLSNGLIAILDMVFALIFCDYLGNTFINCVYIYTSTWYREGIYLLTRSIVCIGLYLLKKKVGNIHELAEGNKYFVLGIGIISCILLIRYQYILYDVVYSTGELSGVSAGLRLVTATMLLILFGFLTFKYRYMKQENDTLLLSEQLLEERYIEMMKTRQVLHDMKNHFLLLQKYEQEQQWEKLHDYLETISEELFEDSARVWSGNTIVDLILNSKKSYVESRDIKVEINTEVIAKFPLANREIVSLFGNLLDNAIEACQKMNVSEKWIDIRIHKRHDVLCIEIENSIAESPKEKNGELISDKRENRVHGYGLKNVKRIVSAHEGTYSYEIGKGWFCTSIVFFDSEEAC